MKIRITNEERIEMERIKWIDQTRGLAIFLVILGHIIGGLDFGVGGGYW